MFVALCVCGDANAQGGSLCGNHYVSDFDLPVYSLVAGYPSGAIQTNIEDYFLEEATRDSGSNDVSCCQGINVRVLPSTLPASCLTITSSPPETANIGSCSQAAGPFSVTIVESIPVCGAFQNVSGCWDPSYGYAIFIARTNSDLPSTSIQALTDILTEAAIVRRTQNPYILSSGLPTDLFGFSTWAGDISTASCQQMHAWSGTLPVACTCAPNCITDDGSAPPDGESCLVDGVGPILTCNQGVCDGPAGNDCILRRLDLQRRRRQWRNPRRTDLRLRRRYSAELR